MAKFDTLMSDAHKQHNLMVRHANGVFAALKSFRRAAYRFAKAIIELQENHHNQLLDLVTTKTRSIDDWMDEHFAPLEQNFNEDRRKLFAAIKEGITEKNYVNEGVIYMVRRRAGNTRHIAHADVDAPLPTAPMSDADKIADLTARFEAARSEVRGLRSDLRTALADNDLQRKAIDRMEKMIVAVKKKAG